MAGERILIVEDNPLNLELVSDVLAARGFRVLTAANAEEAIRLARREHPGLVLMDIALPGLDGLEATRILKRDPETAGIPVVALSAHAMRGDEMRAREAGCSGYITKPVNTRRLAADVERYLGAANAATGASSAAVQGGAGTERPDAKGEQEERSSGDGRAT